MESHEKEELHSNNFFMVVVSVVSGCEYYYCGVATAFPVWEASAVLAILPCECVPEEKPPVHIHAFNGKGGAIWFLAGEFVLLFGSFNGNNRHYSLDVCLAVLLMTHR